MIASAAAPLPQPPPALPTSTPTHQPRHHLHLRMLSATLTYHLPSEPQQSAYYSPPSDIGDHGAPRSWPTRWLVLV